MLSRDQNRERGSYVVGEFGDTRDVNDLSRGREGTGNPVPTTTGRDMYREVATNEHNGRRQGVQRKGQKRVDREVEVRTETGGNDVVELLSSQEPSPRSRQVANRDKRNRVIDLTREESEFEMVSCTVEKTPVRQVVRARRNPDHGGDAKVRSREMALSTTLQFLMGSSKEDTKDEDGTAKNPQCGICFEPMGKNTNNPMAAGNCGHVYCKMCLVRAVKTRKKCPGCSAKMSGKQIRNIFFDVS